MGNFPQSSVCSSHLGIPTGDRFDRWDQLHSRQKSALAGAAGVSFGCLGDVLHCLSRNECGGPAKYGSLLPAGLHRAGAGLAALGQTHRFQLHPPTGLAISWQCPEAGVLSFGFHLFCPQPNPHLALRPTSLGGLTEPS